MVEKSEYRNKKRSVSLDGRHTSISLEQPFWDYLHKMALEREMSMSHLVAEIDDDKQTPNLSSAARIACLVHSINGKAHV
jgi:predicted DNA-binding ribbon-helix-helix protein